MTANLKKIQYVTKILYFCKDFQSNFPPKNKDNSPLRFFNIRIIKYLQTYTIIKYIW